MKENRASEPAAEKRSTTARATRTYRLPDMRSSRGPPRVRLRSVAPPYTACQAALGAEGDHDSARHLEPPRCRPATEDGKTCQAPELPVVGVNRLLWYSLT